MFYAEMCLYQLGFLLQVDDLGEEVRDLLLLSGGVVALPGQLFSQRGNLQVGVTCKREANDSRENQPKPSCSSLLSRGESGYWIRQ